MATTLVLYESTMNEMNDLNGGGLLQLHGQFLAFS